MKYLSLTVGSLGFAFLAERFENYDMHGLSFGFAVIFMIIAVATTICQLIRQFID